MAGNRAAQIVRSLQGCNSTLQSNLDALRTVSFTEAQALDIKHQAYVALGKAQAIIRDINSEGK